MNIACNLSDIYWNLSVTDEIYLLQESETKSEYQLFQLNYCVTSYIFVSYLTCIYFFSITEARKHAEKIKN